jgi:hypothetical protein
VKRLLALKIKVNATDEMFKVNKKVHFERQENKKKAVKVVGFTSRVKIVVVHR